MKPKKIGPKKTRKVKKDGQEIHVQPYLQLLEIFIDLID